MRNASPVLLTLAILGASMGAFADNARDWQNIPININIGFLYYNALDSNTSVDMSVPIDGLSVNANIWLARYAYSFGIDGRNTGIQLLLPYVDGYASVDGLQRRKDNDGMGDASVVLAHNFFGAPALTAEEFSSWKPGTFFSGAIWLTAPTGDYDKDQLINIGTNRWIFKPELAFGTPLGPTWLEINGYVSFYGDNDDFLGDNKFEQRPLYTVEGHYSYTFGPALWASLDTSYKTGGETKINGVLQDNEQDTTMAGASLGFMLSPQFGGMIAYMDTVSKPTGASDSNIWTVRVQYAW